MGNRATIVFHNPGTDGQGEEISPATYVHWNGGPESVYAFLDELDRRRVRTSTTDISYESARFVHVVGDYMDQGGATPLSLGLFPPPASITPAGLAPLDMGDNGIYVITRGAGPGRDRRLVRRFVAAAADGQPRECTRRQVLAEEKSARADSTYAAIGRAFLEIRPVIAEY